MALVAFLKMMGRRLALRKGLAVSAAVLLLLGWCLLYITTRDLGGAGAKSEIPAAPSMAVRVTQGRDLSHKPRPSVNLSHFPPHLQTTPPVPQEPNQPQWWAPTKLNDSLPQCQFTEVTEAANVDLQILDLFEEIPFDNPNGGVWKQGFDVSYSMAAYQQEPLTVFVVPHSHNDPGWLKTFENYYRKQTKLILDKMVEALSTDSRRKFIWAEISFLDLWWNECGQERRQKFKRLVERGQLEIVTGGWVMNDEANTHYFAMIDQMIEGHTWLDRNLPGVVPESSWAIDPFGHTPSMAYLLQRMGLTGMLMQRVHYSVKKRLAMGKELEFLWRQAWDQHGSTDMLTHMMPFYSYDIPHTCGPDPSICCQFDFKRMKGSKVKCPWKKPAQPITDANVQERAELLADQYRKKAQLYRSSTLLVPLGDDFRWDGEKEIEDQFVNYQKLMDYMNSHPDMKIFVQFGTLSDYFSALRGSSWATSQVARGNTPFPILSGDFFTYSDRDDHYWSGYYTSRPFYKHMGRQLEARLRLAEILFSLSVAHNLQTYPTLPDLLTSARRNLGLFQHHDGITGTAKDLVVVDYGQRMKEALEHTNTIIQHSSQALLLGSGIVADSLHFSLEESQNSHDSLPQPVVVRLGLNGPQTVLIMNPLSIISHRMIYITVDTHIIMVTDSEKADVSCQINPVISPSGSVSQDHYQLVFPVSLPALGLVQYQLRPGTQGCSLASLNTINYNIDGERVFSARTDIKSHDIVLSTNQITARFSGSTGLLQSVATGNQEVGVAMDIVTYGVRKGKSRSGAYLFLPDGDAQSLLTPGSTPHISITSGPLVHEVLAEVGLVSVQQRLINIAGVEGQSVTVTTFTDIRKEDNKEVAMRLHSTVTNSDGVFYTDLNGLQLVRRKTVTKLPLQGNFYPMPTMSFLQNSTHRLSLLSAQPHGVASLKSGWLEVILDRRLVQDDQRGLGQGVKDNKLTAANFRLLMEARKQAIVQASPQLAYPSLLSVVTMDTLLHPLHVSFTSSSSKILPHIPAALPLLTLPIPCDVHLLNLRSYSSRHTSALLLHRRGYDCNFLATPESCSVSNGTVKLEALFSGVNVAKVTEMSLSLLQEKGQVRSSGLSVYIPPMEIQTYRISWHH